MLINEAVLKLQKYIRNKRGHQRLNFLVALFQQMDVCNLHRYTRSPGSFSDVLKRQ